MKTQIQLSIDVDVKQRASASGLNISALVNELLRKYFITESGATQADIDALRTQAAVASSKLAEAETAAKLKEEEQTEEARSWKHV
jgi:post-segregation antitoxin (ccd killing protein)